MCNTRGPRMDLKRDQIHHCIVSRQFKWTCDSPDGWSWARRRDGPSCQDRSLPWSIQTRLCLPAPSHVLTLASDCWCLVNKVKDREAKDSKIFPWHCDQLLRPPIWQDVEVNCGRTKGRQSGSTCLLKEPVLLLLHACLHPFNRDKPCVTGQKHG